MAYNPCYMFGGGGGKSTSNKVVSRIQMMDWVIAGRYDEDTAQMLYRIPLGVYPGDVESVSCAGHIYMSMFGTDALYDMDVTSSQYVVDDYGICYAVVYAAVPAAINPFGVAGVIEGSVEISYIPKVMTYGYANGLSAPESTVDGECYIPTVNNAGTSNAYYIYPQLSYNDNRYTTAKPGNVWLGQSSGGIATTTSYVSSYRTPLACGYTGAAKTKNVTGLVLEHLMRTLNGSNKTLDNSTSANVTSSNYYKLLVVSLGGNRAKIQLPMLAQPARLYTFAAGFGNVVIAIGSQTDTFTPSEMYIDGALLIIEGTTRNEHARGLSGATNSQTSALNITWLKL